MADQENVRRKALTSKIETLVAVCVCLLAASLPLPITYTWISLIALIFVWFTWRGSKSTFPLDQGDDTKERNLGSGNPSASNLCGTTFGPLTFPLLLYALAVTVSGAPHQHLSDICQSIVSLRTFLIYFVAVDIFSRLPYLRERSIGWLLLVSSGSGILGAIQQLLNWHPIGFKFLQGTGFQSGPMAFAGQMQLFSMLSLGLLYGQAYRSLPKPLNKKYIYWVVVAANISGVVFSGERSAWLGFLAGVVVLTACIARKLLLKSLVIMAVCGSLAWCFVPLVKTRLMPLTNWQNDVSTRVRLSVWEDALNLFKQSPITGVGVTNFPHLYIKEAIVPGRSKYLDHAHSNYLQALSTTGLIGFLAYLYLIMCVVLFAWRQFYSSREPNSSGSTSIEPAIGLSILSSTIALGVSGIFEYNFGTGPVRLSQWFLAALLNGRFASLSWPPQDSLSDQK
jgi:O-antigen ligase